MKNNPFLDYLPTLDLHGYTTDLITYPINQFIEDNIKLGNYKLVIIHGIGKGILKEEIRYNLKKDKRINKMYGDFRNPGITILELNR